MDCHVQPLTFDDQFLKQNITLNHQQIAINEVLSSCIEKNQNFSIFSYPNSSEIQLILENPLLKNHSDIGFIMRPFEMTNQNQEVFIPADFHLKADTDWSKFALQISHLPSGKRKKMEAKPYFIDKENYLKDLRKGISAMSMLKVDKFIYSRIESIEKTKYLDLAKLFFSISNNHKNAFVYLVHHAQSGYWMGATPETLSEWTGSSISTMSLAGTQPDLGKEPIWKEKEKEEQQYVTQYIETCFSKNRIAFSTDETKSVKAGPVYHLHNQISSNFPVNFMQVLHLTQSLHPTPAICGVPLPRAKSLIQNIERHQRDYYTGYLGVIDPNKEVRLFVNLRCMQIFSNFIGLYLGGGITNKSVPEKEWEETVFKSQTLLKEIESLTKGNTP